MDATLDDLAVIARARMFVIERAPCPACDESAQLDAAPCSTVIHPTCVQPVLQPVNAASALE